MLEQVGGDFGNRTGCQADDCCCQKPLARFLLAFAAVAAQTNLSAQSARIVGMMADEGHTHVFLTLEQAWRFVETRLKTAKNGLVLVPFIQRVLSNDSHAPGAWCQASVYTTLIVAGSQHMHSNRFAFAF
jgi:hypothetical protein